MRKIFAVCRECDTLRSFSRAAVTTETPNDTEEIHGRCESCERKYRDKHGGWHKDQHRTFKVIA